MIDLLIINKDEGSGYYRLTLSSDTLILDDIVNHIHSKYVVKCVDNKITYMIFGKTTFAVNNKYDYGLISYKYIGLSSVIDIIREEFPNIIIKTAFVLPGLEGYAIPGSRLRMAFSDADKKYFIERVG